MDPIENDYDAKLGLDQNGNRVINAEADVYAASDTTFSTPLVITDTQGVPMAKLYSNSDGIYPAFRVPSGELSVRVKSGNAITPMTSLAVFAKAASDAALAAKAGAEDADAARRVAEEARDGAQQAVTTEVLEAAAALAQSEVGLVRSDPIVDNLVTFTDDLGHRSWLEIDTTNGGPSEHSSNLLYESIRAKVRAQASSEGWTLVELDPDQFGYVFAIADSTGRWCLAVGPDGRVHIPKLVSDAALQPGSVTETYLSPQLQKRLWPAPLGAQIMASGDSQTALGSGYASYVSAELDGASVVIEAMGGHGVDEIAARQGGRPARVTVQGNTIPAAVAAVAVSLDIDLYWQTDGTGTLSKAGVIQGIPGTLTRDRASKTYTFTRDVAGSAVWVAPGSPFFSATSLANREAIQLFLIGRNSIHATTEGSTSTSGAPWTPQKIADRLSQMLRYLRERESRYLVIELFPTRGDVIGSDRRTRVDEYNRLARELAPANYLPITYYLLNKALADAGITPTAEDISYRDQGVIGPSLSADGVHLEPVINQLLARFIAREIRTRGWIN